MSGADWERQEEQRRARELRRLRREERLAQTLAAQLERINDLIREHAAGAPVELEIEEGRLVGHTTPVTQVRERPIDLSSFSDF